MGPTDNPLIKVETLIKGLTYLAGVLGFLSVFRYLDYLYAFLFLAVFFFSIYLEYREAFFIPRWALNIMSLAVVVASFFRINPDDFGLQMVEALILLLAIKFLEAKKVRDYMQIYTITVFLLAGSALMSIDIIFLLYFAGLIFIITVAIIMLTYYSHDHKMLLEKKIAAKIMLKSLMLPLISIPATALMFIVLPRTNYPLADFLNRAETARSGFTDNVQLGDVSSIQRDASIIFRANMERVSDDNLYWRGLVMDYFDGSSWRVMRRSEFRLSDKLKQAAIKQTIYLEPYGSRYLMALDKPVAIALKGVTSYRDLTFSLPANIERRLRYEAFSVISDFIHEEGADREIYLQLPGKLAPEITTLAGELTADKENAREITEALLRFFLSGGRFKYSLENLPITKKPLEDFLFKHRYGNCEYFASAMAALLRAAKVPARVVGGYRGGYYNEVGGYYLVSQENAHVWVEAYLENGRWIRLDPTPAGIENFNFSKMKGPLFKVRLFFDSLNYYWNAVVINYNFQKQVALLSKLRLAIKKPAIKISLNKTEALKYVLGLSAIFSLITCIYFLVFRRRSYEERLMAGFLREMEKNGYKKNKAEGLEEFISKMGDNTLRTRAERFVAEFESLYYKDKKMTRDDMRRLKKMLHKKR